MASPDQVLAQVRELGGDPTRVARGPSRPRQQSGGDDRALATERETLKAALQRPGLCGPSLDTLEESHFTAERHRDVFQAVLKAGGTQAATSPATWVGIVADSCVDDEARQLALELAVEGLRYAGDDEAQYVAAMIRRLREFGRHAPGFPAESAAPTHESGGGRGLQPGLR